MKKNNRKGFTIVELVIVIAVIAILAGVLIPTFSGVVKKAQESAELQEVKNAYTNALVEVLADGEIEETSATFGGYTFNFAEGKLTSVTETTEYKYTVTDGVITAAEKK